MSSAAILFYSPSPRPQRLACMAGVVTGSLLGFTINAAGSPATNKVVTEKLYDLESRINIAKEIAGI